MTKDFSGGFITGILPREREKKNSDTNKRIDATEG
jgi:hypothetical protein